MRKVYTAGNLPEAHLILHLLRNQGIDARVFNENACSVFGELPLSASLPEVWVTDVAYEARAIQMIDTFRQQAASGVVHLCTECGEQNPGEFEICWKCGLAFPVLE
ncbi:MAG TPA: DUF2007 domain-containing protein [Burkholderiales bacterium]|nr:DUF2007 domain-containing protein [Burkholderiales bacterium]